LNKQTFNAQLALLNRRWPWPEAAGDAEQDYNTRLWARVESWRKEQVAAFRQVVERLVSAPRYSGRPSVDELTSAAHTKLASIRSREGPVDRYGERVENIKPVSDEARARAAKAVADWLEANRGKGKVPRRGPRQDDTEEIPF